MKEMLLTIPKEKKALLIPAELNKNNFDCLRFFLATAVIYSHCFVIYYGKINNIEPVKILTRNQVDLGGIAVSFFFVISGFLIVKSFENSNTINEYLLKRIFRIYPGFFVAFLVSVLVFGAMGTLYSTHPIEHLKYYLHSFTIKRLIFQFFTLEAPRGPKTFSTNPLPNMINEALWTIQYEFTCYLAVPFLGLVSLLKRKWLALSLFLVAYILLVLQMTNLIPYDLGYKGKSMFLSPSELPRLFAFFFSGSCFYLFRDHIKFSKALFLLCITVMLFVSYWITAFYIMLPLAGSYLMFCFVYNRRIQFHDFAKKGDFSYGLYLYGWPVQQLILYFFSKDIDPDRLFFISFPVAFFAAYLSWHIIESPMLKMKKLIKTKVIAANAVA